MPITQWSDTILIAELGDEPAFSEDLDTLIRRLDAATEPLPDVILNMAAVTYMNSSNIAQLLKVRKRLETTGTRLRICAVADQVWSVLLVTGLDNVFTFTDDISTALASLLIEGDG